MAFIHALDQNVHYTSQGSGRAVVFVHGNWGSLAWWDLVLQRLPLSLQGVAYDLRGRGKTDGEGTGYTMPEMAADLTAFCDALGIEKVHLVGHSLGSAIAMEFLLEHSERVLSMTAVAPAWVDGMPEAFNSPDGQRAIKQDKVLFARALKALAPTVEEDEYWQRLVDEGHEQRLEAALRNLPALVDWHPGYALKAAGVPALVVVGSLDPLTGGANAVMAAEALNARYELMEGVGHSPIIESPDRFVDLLLGFIAEVERNGA